MGGLTLDLRSDPDKSVSADPQQLRRAIAHLLDNAIRATPSGGKITVEIRQKKDVTRISIADTGTGMSHHDMARALEGIRPSLEDVYLDLVADTSDPAEKETAR